MRRTIERQLKLNRSLNLLYRDLGSVAAVDGEFKRRLLELKERREDISERELSEVVESTVEALYRVNQYLELDEAVRARLRDLYRETFAALDPANVERGLKEHLVRLGEIIAPCFPEAFRAALAETPQIGRVVNEEYSPEFQLRLLGLTAEELKAPVLDLGCGRSAGLVRYLRERGIEARGLDRSLVSATGYLTRASWFEYRFEPESWGTVIANMSFSNHFVFAARNRRERLVAYMEVYGEILDSLEPGGAFIYAPGLPGVEKLLDPELFLVRATESAAGVSITTVRKR